MVQGRPVLNLVNLTAWLTGILVSLAVGFGMVEKVLVIKWIPEIITVVAGWIVVVLTIVSIVFAIANKLWFLFFDFIYLICILGKFLKQTLHHKIWKRWY